MNLLVVTLSYNEEVALPFFLRHYEKFADRIVVYDSGSTDGTLDILRGHPLVELRQRPPTFGLIDDLNNIRYKTEGWKDGYGDWVMTPDADELLWSWDIRADIQHAEEGGFNVIKSEGWDMIGDEVPVDGQLYDHIKQGVRSPNYDKTLLFKPSMDMKHSPGCHEYSGCNVRVAPFMVKLLHYKWLSLEHVARKSQNLQMSERNHQHKHGYTDGIPSKDVWVDMYRRGVEQRKPLDFLNP